MRDWISEDERYDPQCQDVEQARCSCCHELVPADELKHFFGGDQVCAECLGNYLREQGEEFTEDFVKENEDDYLLSWWDTLDKSDRVTYLKTLYQSLRLTRAEELAEDRREYCRQSQYFPSFVEERLS